MNKKLIIIIAAVVVVVGVALYMFVFKSSEVPIKYTNYSPGEYFVTNVKESNRLLKVSIVLVLNTDKLQDQLTEDNSKIRDAIIFILRDLDEATLRTQGTEAKIKETIINVLNERLGIDNIVEVLFNDYVMQ